jgi:hypothetical protein
MFRHSTIRKRNRALELAHEKTHIRSHTRRLARCYWYPNTISNTSSGTPCLAVADVVAIVAIHAAQNFRGIVRSHLYSFHFSAQPVQPLSDRWSITRVAAFVDNVLLYVLLPTKLERWILTRLLHPSKVEMVGKRFARSKITED